MGRFKKIIISEEVKIVTKDKTHTLEKGDVIKIIDKKEMSLIKELLNGKIAERQMLIEMANYIPSQTGLPFDIWIRPKAPWMRHWARIKLYKDQSVTITISDNPEIKDGIIKPGHFRLIKQFIKKNKKMLLAIWNGDITEVIRFKK